MILKFISSFYFLIEKKSIYGWHHNSVWNRIFGDSEGIPKIITRLFYWLHLNRAWNWILQFHFLATRNRTSWLSIKNVSPCSITFETNIGLVSKIVKDAHTFVVLTSYFYTCPTFFLKAKYIRNILKKCSTMKCI